MDAASLLVLAGAGAAVGLIAGFVGIGGASLLAPAILLVFQRLPISEAAALRTAFGTALAASGLIAAAAFATHRARLGEHARLAYLLGPTVAVGALGGAAAASAVGAAALRTAFGVGALVTAGWMTVSREGAQSRETSLPAALIIPLGLAIGFFAALAGMGGAVFSIMILVGFFHVPMRMVAGVCTFVQVCGAAFGCVGYALGGVGEAQVVPLSVGYVNLPAAVAIAAVGVPLAMVGARLAQRARPAAARKVLAGLLVLLAAQMLKVW